MRIVFMGASPLTVLTAEILLGHDHDVVIIDKDPQKIETLSERLDCGFVEGDGSRPDLLRELNPEKTDFLFCLSDSDRDNIIAAMVAKTLSFERIVTKLEDPGYQQITRELELVEAIVPDQHVARGLVEMVNGKDRLELSDLFETNVGFFSFTVETDEFSTIGDIELPRNARIVSVTRDERSIVAHETLELEPGDKVVLLCEDQYLRELMERYAQS